MAGKKVTFEQELEKLRDVVERLERGELSLEEGVELYKQGLALARSCRKRLATAENEVKVYQDELLVEFKADSDDGPAGEGEDG